MYQSECLYHWERRLLWNCWKNPDKPKQTDKQKTAFVNIIPLKKKKKKKRKRKKKKKAILAMFAVFKEKMKSVL